MKSLKIIFMGTPEFAVPSLQTLVEAGQKVVAVITAPDKPKGRGQKLAMSPVKEYAVSQDIPVLQPTNLKNPEFIEELRSYEADLQVVVAFRMLPEVVWSMPTEGTFNLHASLLPQYRGAAPINWAIINGEKETGATTFMLKHEIDTGSIMYQIKEPIHPEDNVGTVYERLMHNGAKLVLKTVEKISEGNYDLQPQDESTELKHAPKIFKETCEIHWDKTTEEIHNLVRGLSPYPAAWTTLQDKTMKVYQTEIVEEEVPTGTFKTDGKNYLYFGTADGTLSILDLQLQGKKRMKITDFLRGYKFN
ncbi:methionyl-tRNA formyltransferase [Persicobacter sp. CCB-QB2]|uniref:methionyl-tRNA formyltransferase n=1 Tax=Persicobacter sp. CCB-QB2 TaxID=1561025 RepID=UPI00092F5B53|nr:methionyl-tRNA formyltransferase [Persicobacter sp. CCB-QB2]